MPMKEHKSGCNCRRCQAARADQDLEESDTLLPSSLEIDSLPDDLGDFVSDYEDRDPEI
jgi:hypothetical protein